MHTMICPECSDIEMDCVSYTFINGSDDCVEYEETWICPECGKAIHAKVCLNYS